MRAAYVHVPFCRHRCGYCNFTLVAGRDDLEPAFLDALQLELSSLGRPQAVDTLFIGGGTPSHLSAESLQRLLDLLSRWLPVSDGGEYSVEANPLDVDAALLERLAGAGVNRLSLGVQSFEDAVLRTLERDHRGADARRAVELCQQAIRHVAADSIFAAPDQTLDQWRRDLQAVKALRLDHVSTYGLTYEKGAAFWSRRRRGQLRPVDEETERQMYLEAIAALTGCGLEHYEVSNFARPGSRCRHNLNYWQGGDYLAFGPGAARHCRGRRETNHRSTTAYIQRMLRGRSPVAESEQLTPEQRARERLVFGLRMLEGVEREDFYRASGRQLDELAGEAIARHVAAGRLLDDGRRLRLSPEGLLVSDAIVVDLL